MSTRCQIAFYKEETNRLNNWQALLYKHHDGDPESMVIALLPILKEFKKKRGLWDIEYCAAYVAAHLKAEIDKYGNPSLKNGICLTEIGISKAFHGDIQFLYAVHPSNKIKIYKADCWGKRNKFNFLESVDI